jgi:hypothetical protein
MLTRLCSAARLQWCMYDLHCGHVAALLVQMLPRKCSIQHCHAANCAACAPEDQVACLSVSMMCRCRARTTSAVLHSCMRSPAAGHPAAGETPRAPATGSTSGPSWQLASLGFAAAAGHLPAAVAAARCLLPCQLCAQPLLDCWAVTLHPCWLPERLAAERLAAMALAPTAPCC